MSNGKRRDADKMSAEEQGALFGAAHSLLPASPPASLAALRPAAPTKAAKTPPADDKVGHRERLRDRFRDGGPNAVADYELLEMILFRVFPRGDTKPIAKRLIDKFGSFAETVTAPPERLKEVDGIGERAVDEIKLIKAAAERMAHGHIKAKHALSSWNGVLDYLRLRARLRRARTLPDSVSRQEKQPDFR